MLLRSSARWLIAPVLVSSLALLAQACGGKVIVDDTTGGGAGGAGTTTGSGSGAGSTVGSVTSGPTSTAATGPGTCDCSSFCGKFDACNVPIKQCQNICDSVPPDIMQCVCNLPNDCKGLKDCISGIGSGSGSGSGSSGSGGGNDCNGCTNQAAGSACMAETNACFQDKSCGSIVQCVQSCGVENDCAACEQKFPDGDKLFNDLVQCAVCSSCGDVCFDTPIFNSHCVTPL
ncbi:MAG: hypothetical protein U0359_18715 [Byssovorax sp.]